MKRLILSIATTLMVIASQAKIVYLNNNLSAPKLSENLYVNWTNAYAACNSGDTLYVIGSNFSHGDITINKTINIVGPGYFLNENIETQVNKKSAIFDQITFAAGSDNSMISGIAVSYRYDEMRISNTVNNLTVKNCYLPYIDFLTDNNSVNNNIKISNCYLWGSTGITHNSYKNGILSNLIFSNNIIQGSVHLPDGSTGIVSHNLFIHNTLRLGSSSSFEIANNIYINTNGDNFTIQPLPDAAVHHNISITVVFGSDNDNFTAPESTLFISDENASTDGTYQLASDSPAKSAGDNGVDIGPFGGADPYRLSGLPDLPNIYGLSTGGFVSGDALPVHIKIKQ